MYNFLIGNPDIEVLFTTQEISAHKEIIKICLD